MILGMMTGTGSIVGGYWFFGPVAEGGASGGSQLFYLRTQDPTNWSVALRPAPAGFSSITRITSANGAVFMFGAAGQQAVSFNAGASWTACSGLTHDATLDVFWNGNFYYHNTSRSADGITWSAIPSLPSATTIRLARQSDGAIVGWQDFPGYSFQISTDDSVSWTTRSGYGTSGTDTLATDGSRIVFSYAGNVGAYTDDLFATFSSPGGASQYSAYFGGGGFVAKGFPTGLIDMGDGSTQGSATLNVDTGSRQAANVWGGDSIWTAVQITTGTPALNTIHVSTDGAATWSSVAALYGAGQNICSLAQRA